MNSNLDTIQCSNSDINDPLQIDSRCRVIKVLQEQITNQTTENTDLDNLKSQILISEQTFQMKESEYKLRIDDLEFEVEQLRKENQKLKSSVVKNKTLLLNLTNDNEMAKKYQKWKSKYHSLINNDPSFQNAAKVYKLESNIKAIQIESRKKQEEFSRISEENEKLKARTIQLGDEVKKIKASLDSSNSKNASLQTQVASLTAENKKLFDQTRQKGSLLQFNRKVQARDQKSSKEKEQTAKAEIKHKTDENINLQSEITRLKAIFDKEMKEKRIVVKKYNCLKQKQNNVADTLNHQIVQLKSENASLLKELEDVRESLASLDNEVSLLKSEQTVSQIKLKKAEKLKEHNFRLSQTIADMQETIDHLQSSISSIESDSTAKTEELRLLLAKHYAGIDPIMDWDDIVNYIDNLIEQLKSSTFENSELQKKLKKAVKNNSFLRIQNESTTESVSKQIEELEDQIEKYKEQISKLESERKTCASTFPITLRKKIDSGFSLYFNTIASIMAKINRNDFHPLTMRSLVLMSILITRLKHYKKSDPYDGSTILEFVKKEEIPTKSPVLQLSDKFDELLNKTQKSIEMNASLKSINDDLQDKIKKCIIKYKELQSKIIELNKVNEDLQNKLNQTKTEKNNEASAHYNELELKLQQKTKDCLEIKRQLSQMKCEMKRLISTVDEHHMSDQNLQSTIEDLTYELEQLRQDNSRMKQELEISQLSMKEKNKEILSLERKLLKQRTQVVVVKDQIPTGMIPQPLADDNASTTSNASKKSDFYMTDSLRNTLSQMQNKLMKTSEMI